MDTLSIAVPADLKEYVRSRAAAGGYDAVDDYVSDLIREDRKRQWQLDLEAELLRRIDGPMEEMTAQDWEELRENVRRRSASSASG